MIGVFLSTLFWNNVLNAKIPKSPQISTHKVWEASSVVEEETTQNQLFDERLIDSSKKIAQPMPEFSKKVLVVAPHPDDEILCCANTIKEHLLSGDDVSIVVITNGDGKSENNRQESLDYGRQRQNESLHAAKKLGIPLRKIYFLGFPDGNLADIERRGSSRSQFTNLMQTMRSSLFPGTPYTWNGLQQSLKKVLQKSTPDVVYLPGVEDLHEDHRVSANAVRVAANTVHIVPIWKEYVVHSKNKSCVEQSVDKQKLALIREFKTQRHDRYHSEFLEKFASCKEEFRDSANVTNTKNGLTSVKIILKSQ